jgi:hypothetical protein
MRFIIDAGWRGKWTSDDPNIEYIIELLEDCDAEYTTTPLPDEPQQLQFTFE